MEWQPIESAPKDGTKVLISDGEYIWIGQYEKYQHGFNDGKFCWVVFDCAEDTYFSETYELDRVTHWMPLPDAPKPPTDESNGK